METNTIPPAAESTVDSHASPELVQAGDGAALADSNGPEGDASASDDANAGCLAELPLNARWAQAGSPDILERTCGARGKRTGLPCPHTAVYANGRCRWHGGLSTGPKTAEGRAKAAMNSRWRERLADPADARPGAGQDDGRKQVAAHRLQHDVISEKANRQPFPWRRSEPHEPDKVHPRVSGLEVPRVPDASARPAGGPRVAVLAVPAFLLMAVFNRDPARWWTTADLASALHMPEPAVLKTLAEQKKLGRVVSTAGADRWRGAHTHPWHQQTGR